MAVPVTVAVGAPITSTDHNALIPQILHLREEQTSGTAGGAFTAGGGSPWLKRGLNVVALNTITGASMAASVITLPAGVYNVRGWASANTVGGHKTRLQQTSGTPATLVLGSNESAVVASSAVTSSIVSIDNLTLTGSTQIEFQHQCLTTKTVNGMGVALSLGTELYSEIVFTKVG